MNDSEAAGLKKALDDLARGQTRSTVERVIDIAVKVMLVAAPGFAGILYGHSNRLTALEATAVTAKEFQVQMSTVNEKLMAASNGPQWLRDSLAGVNAKLDVVRDSMSALTERVVRVESSIDKK